MDSRERCRSFPVKLGRREFLALLGTTAAGAVVTLACGQENFSVEPTSSSRKVDLSGMGLIPKEFAEKGTYNVIVEEIRPRLGLNLPYDSGFDSYRDRYRVNYSANTAFSSKIGSFSLTVETPDYRYPDKDYDITIVFDVANTSNRYLFTFGNRNDTRVIDGETATEEEAKETRKSLDSILIGAFNEAIKNGDVLTIFEHYDKKVTPTPNLTPHSDTF